MNRRTVLRTAGVTAVAGLSGCIEALQEHYEGSFQGLVPIEIHSEADHHYNVILEAYAVDEDRQTYDESYTVRAGETASPPHLDAAEQRFRATKMERETDEQLTKEATVTPNVDLISVRLTDDDLILDVERGEEDDEPAPESEPSRFDE
ncbi:hypothetical protein [Natrinema salifodinae]|uniref:Uncharacterized protein n=1 Tax=Natrinema salifodinae TaxID=1202768 RepID=A0A1I0MLI3_9EURY|nr:hypothetical protein [Natrinema salifodinae]SEV88742.1 hypothetical protein SAMN05216285_1079 [Natrinema salifodinae]